MQKNKRRIKLGRRFLSALDLPEEAAGAATKVHFIDVGKRRARPR